MKSLKKLIFYKKTQVSYYSFANYELRERERERLADDFAVQANIARAMPKVLPLRLVDIAKND